MKNTMDIIRSYTAGTNTLEETNAALQEAGAGFFLNPQKNNLTEADKRATTIGYYPDQVNGYGLLDTGTGSFDKVLIKDGKLVNCDCGDMDALIIIAGRVYQVQGNTLAD